MENLDRINAEIDTSKKHLKSIRDTIAGRGVDLPNPLMLSDIPQAIRDIPADTGLSYITNDEIAYEKNVPNNVENYAIIEKLGGTFGDRIENLVYSLERHSSQDEILDGITRSINNGVVHLSGRYSGSTMKEAQVDALIDIPIQAGEVFTFTNFYNFVPNSYYKVYFYDGAVSRETFNVYDVHVFIPKNNGNRLMLRFYYNVEPNIELDIYYYPVMLKGEFSSYIPKNERIVTTQKTNIISSSYNLFNTQVPIGVRGKHYSGRSFVPGICFQGLYSYHIMYATTSDFYWNTTNIRNIDLSAEYIKFDVTGSPYPYCLGFTFFLEPDTNYTFSYQGVTDSYSGSSAQPWVYIYELSNSGSSLYHRKGYTVATGAEGRTISFTTGVTGKIMILFSANISAGFRTMIYHKPMLYKGDGSKQLDFCPYYVDSFELSTELQSFLSDKEFGFGFGEDCNYIDFIKEKYIQKYGRFYLTNNNFQYNTEQNLYYISLDECNINFTNLNIICNALPNVDIINSNQNGIYISVPDNMLYIRKTDYTSKEEYDNWLNNEGIYIIEKLPEQQEYNISQYLSNENYIKVWENGTIMIDNDYKLPIPSKVNYIYKRDKAE